jgi:galactokinase
MWWHPRIPHQELALALALTEQLLENQGGFRAHGGGFAGTIQAFVPVGAGPELCGEDRGGLWRGTLSCSLRIRPVGGIEVTPLED